MSENNSAPKPLDSRMVFIAIALIAFVWTSIFIILPALTGKEGVAQKMQQDLKKIQDELATLEVVGEASGGKVKVILTCNNIMERIWIDPSMFTGQEEDLELLQDVLKLAINDGIQKAKQLSDSRMESVASGISIPPGF